jgi:hypothetical protein
LLKKPSNNPPEATNWGSLRAFVRPHFHIILLEEIAEAALDGKRKEHMEILATV